MGSVRFEPAGPLRGEVTPPADKSLSHRTALFGAMCDEPLTIHNYLEAEDTQSTLGALQALGAGVDEHPGELVIRGVGLRGALDVTGGVLDVGNSGTLMRLLPGWLAGQGSGRWTLDGDDSIRRRPVDRVAEPLRLLGAEIDVTRRGPAADDRPRLRARGDRVRRCPSPSAQVKSCCLIAGLLARGETTVIEPYASRDHTERLLRRARAPFERDGLKLTVRQIDELELDQFAIPGDPSAAAFVVAAATLVPKSRVMVKDACLNWTRTGFFRIAERMGAVILGDLEEPGTVADHEPVGELDVAAAPLEGTTVEPEEVPLAVDEIPLLALMGAFAEGETVVKGAEELRIKESNRIEGVVEGLGGLGADIEETDDGFVVRGTGGIRGGTIDARGDHRLAMLGAVAGLASDEGVEVVGMQAAAVSYPEFETDVQALLAA